MKEWILQGERLFFVTYNERLFGVMAFSSNDAYRQVCETHFESMVGMYFRMAA